MSNPNILLPSVTNISLFLCAYLTLLFSISKILAHHMQTKLLQAPHEIEHPNRLFLQPPSIRLFLLLSPFAIISAFTNNTLSAFFFHLIFLIFLVYITTLDLRHEIILNSTLSAFSVAAIFHIPWSACSIVDLFTAGIGSFFFLLLLAILTRGGIGGGDIKLLFVLGLWLGTDLILQVFLWSFLTGGICSLFLLLTKKKKRSDTIAYAPYFCLSAAILSFF